MKKTVLVVLMSCMILLSLSPTSYAAQPETAVPLWENADTFSVKLTFDRTTGKVSSTIWGQSGVTNISASVALYYKNSVGTWIAVDNDWDYNVNRMLLSISETFTGVEGREYKIEVTATLTKNGNSETISKTATAICPNN